MIARVAFLSMHTSPLLQPGSGDAGGMNVSVDEIARTMAARGVAADVYTRRDDVHLPDQVEVSAGYRVIHVDAGPSAPLTASAMARYVRRFAVGVVAGLEDAPAEIIHAHYWLSGWAGLLVKRWTGRPLANSFHTLGKIKDLTRRGDDPPESLLRIAAEHEVIEGSDCLIVSTPIEADDLMAHYGAHPGSICTSPPGVDHRVFHPGSQTAARRRLGLGAGPLLLYVGRIQPTKGPDVAVEAFGAVAGRLADARLLIVGGPSGGRGESELDRLKSRVSELGLAASVRFMGPVPHGLVADLYRAADLVLAPSRSETFGLVAAEAQACGTPVVAARIGGLTYVIKNGETGVLIDGWDPVDYAEAALRVLSAPDLAAEMGRAGVAWARAFSWEATARRFLELYGGMLKGG